jgi:polysaccharide export outer membrane protein
MYNKLRIFCLFFILSTVCFSAVSEARTHSKDKKEKNPAPAVVTPAGVICTTAAATKDYLVGSDDVLDISVLKPESLFNEVTVSPDGNITFPYIGTVKVNNKTLAQIQSDIQSRLNNGYMKYPVVSVALKASNSRRFFVYGEVSKPGAYSIEDNMTALRGISMAGGFTQFGSSSRVKILRPKKGTGGYDVIKVSISDVMNGAADSDPAIVQGDIIVVSEGVF